MCGSPITLGFVNFALFLNRLTLGALFALAGFWKLWPEKGIHGYGFVDFFKQSWAQVEGFSANVVVPNAPDWLPGNLAGIYGHSLPFVEMVTGGLLAVGLLARVNAFLITLMLISFMLAFGITWSGGPGASPFDKNLILVTLAFLLVFSGPGAVSIDRLIFGPRPCPPPRD